MLKRISFLVLAALLAGPLAADPLSKKADIDFFRDVPSRNLKGLATRSDGRLVAGPTFSELDVKAPADLLWSLTPGADSTHWLLGTGPEGKIIVVTFNTADATYGTREFAKIDDSHVFNVLRLADGSVLAGSAPHGGLFLIRDGNSVARVGLPVDSIIDLALLDEHTALAGTGNPGRVYRIDLAKFAAAGVTADKITDAKILEAKGVVLFGEVRDRNVRRLAVLTDGRVIAGSSPKGNVYAFAHDGGAPVILQENQNAEITDLLPQPDGDFFAAVAFSAASTENRPAPAATKPTADVKPTPEVVPAPVQEKFGGRSALVWFPVNGFPETLVTRNAAAFYRLARHGDLVVIAGGEAGELLGYNLKTRLSLTFAGSISSQLTSIVPIAGAPGKFFLIRNNAPGLALLDFNAAGPREAETRRLDLGIPALLGALRFNRLRNLEDAQLTLETKTSNGSDEIEGWTAWTPLTTKGDGWRADGLRGRYVKLRLRLAAAAPATAELDKAALFLLPQNRRPVLTDFRVLTPNYGIIPAVDPAPSAVVTYGQVLGAAPRDDDAKRKATLGNSQIVPAPGTQVVFWTVTDPDGDNVTCTFSVRREGDTTWTDVATNTRDGFAQFETSPMPDGVYFTRLVATETAPRPLAERLTAIFETDDLVVDHAPPEILAATAKQDWEKITITLHGRDALSLLAGIEVNFTNGLHETLEQPDDGVRDSRDETFTLDVPVAKAAGASSAEVILYDTAGNASTRRVKW